MNAEKLVKRFDRYFKNCKDPKMRELRKYLREYSELARTEHPYVYVPRIFICLCTNPNHLITGIAWGLNYRVVFPPTDFVFLELEDVNTNNINQLGYVKTENLIEKLDPYLKGIDSFTFTRKLTSDYLYAYENDEFIEPIIQDMPRPYASLIGFAGLDIIPPLEENEIYQPGAN